jgi:hypothetical protein
MVSLRSLGGVAALLTGLGLAGAAGAAPAIVLADMVPKTKAAMSPLPLGYRPAGKPLPDGVARTSVDHRFARSGSDDYVGAAGLLCGLKPEADVHGAAAAFGADPDGKFVGAKLTIAF